MSPSVNTVTGLFAKSGHGRLSWHAAAVLLIVCLGLGVYFNSLFNGFYMDDYLLIHEDRAVSDGAGFLWNFSRPLRFFPEYYRPLQVYSLRLDYFLWGPEPFGFHLTSVLLHLFNAVLLYVLLAFLCRRLDVPLLASLFFLCHPVFSEPVNYIAGRSDLLAGTFFLLTLIFYLLAKARANALYRALSCAVFFLALLSKETALLIPVFLLLWETVGRKEFRTLLSYFLVAGVFCVLRSVVVPVRFLALPSVPLLLSLPKIAALYLAAFLFPLDLSKHWGLPLTVSVGQPAFWGPLAVLLLAAYAVVRVWRRSRIAGLGLGWFLVAPLLFTCLLAGTRPPQVAAFSYAWLYGPTIACLMGLGVLLDQAGQDPRLRKTTATAGVLVVGLLAVSCVVHNQRWADPSYMSFERTVLSVLPQNMASSIRATNKGVELFHVGKRQEALEELHRAFALDPGNFKALINIGVVYLELGELDEAMRALEEAESLRPQSALTAYNKGLIHLLREDEPGAIEEFKKATQRDFYHADAHYNLMVLYARQGKEEEALHELAVMKYLYPSFEVRK